MVCELYLIEKRVTGMHVKNLEQSQGIAHAQLRR